jgi:hypothetical protein
MIKILIAGDFCPRGRIEHLILEQKMQEIYHDYHPHLQGNDINVVNLECPLINKGEPIDKAGPNLSAREECVAALNYGNFNLVTLANNHIMDMGAEGLAKTMSICKANNIAFIGAGENKGEASRWTMREINGTKIAFLNFCEHEFSIAGINTPGANPLNPVKNYYDIKTAHEQADYVIVIVHGGHEGYNLPSPRMMETSRFFIDAGARFVINHHSHCISGYEEYNEGVIFYGLGNYIFDWEGERHSDWNLGFSVKLLLDKEMTDFQIIPYTQCGETPGLYLLSGSETRKMNLLLEQLNAIIADQSLLSKEWEAFVQKNKKVYLMEFEFSASKIYKSLRSRNLIPGMLSRKKKKQLLNLIRCESHRDLAIESLKPGKPNQ